MAEEYTDILEEENELLEEFYAFLGGGDVSEPIYTDYLSKESFAIYDRAAWEETIAFKGFSSEAEAIPARMYIRREATDELICKDRTFLVHDYSRKDFYELEIQRMQRKVQANNIEKAGYSSIIDTATKAVSA
jgi:hypothetical protein